MKSFVIYDSAFGNTEKIAQSIAAGLKSAGTVRIAKARTVTAEELKSIELLVVGSPVLGGRPSTDIKAFLDRLRPGSLVHMKVATFDTRMTMLITKLFGSAAVRVEAMLKEKGGTPIAPPEGFVVLGRSGPLKEGEIEHAARWAHQLASKS
jgi:flavodoxin